MGNKALPSHHIDRAVQVYDAIVWYMDSEERSPSIRELMVIVGLGCSATIQRYLGILRDWGWITTERFAARTIRLTRPTETIVEMPKPARKAKRRHVA